MKQAFALGLVLPLLAATALAQDLKVGMDAPPLKIAKWVKGSAVEAFKPGQIYVVEFWATWCGPCIAGMPHLSSLQRSYKDKGVTIVSVSSADDRNTLADVEAMVANKKDGMDYTVAWDDGTKTADAYLKAAKRSGIPCAFLVDGKGKIAFIDHPMLLDAPLAGVVAGTWDATKDKVDLNATLKQVREAVDAAAKDADKGKGAMEAAAGKNEALTLMSHQMLFDRLIKDGAFDRAFAVGAKTVDLAIAARDDQILNHVSWGIVDPAVKIEKRDLDLAMKAAVKAVELSNEKDGAILDTLARVWFWKGDIQKALDLQKKAVAVERNPDQKAQLVDALKEYEKLVDKAKADKPKTDK